MYRLLHEASDDSVLSWNERFDIILGTAKGLAHLHQSNTIHYNIKSSNILIDCNGQPKVGDYGLARLLPMLDRYVLSSKIQSALGYMAPEFACRTVKITEKCDVYGFGILILEVVTGRDLSSTWKMTLQSSVTWSEKQWKKEERKNALTGN